MHNLVARCSPFMLFIMLLMTGVPSLKAQPASIEGRIIDVRSEEPLPRINVVVESEAMDVWRGTSTDADGRYRFEGLPAGRYVLSASAIGYRKYEREMVLAADAARSIYIGLERRYYGLDELVVNASRRTTFTTTPTSLTVIGPKEIETQTAISGDMGAILAQQVPGLATSSGTLSNYGQTLRGRSVAVLIDGIPQSVPLREAFRDLRTIHPSALETVEVVRGASAIYGYGGAGGVVNYVTKRPSADGLNFRLEAGPRFQASDVRESLGGHGSVQGMGRFGKFDVLLNASYERWGQFFDAQNDLIPQDPQAQGGLAGSDEVNLLAKTGYQIDANQRITALLNFYDFKQDLSLGTVAGVVDSVKATTTNEFAPLGEDPGTENFVAGLNYTHDDILASELSLRAYYQDYMTRFGYSTFFPDGGGQSVAESQKAGLRFDIATPVRLVPGSMLLWGVDALRDVTSQPLEDGRPYVPPISQFSVAPFAQVKVSFGEIASATGGVRYQNFHLSVDDYTTLTNVIDTDGDGTADAPNQVEGGELTYDALVFNAGLTFYVTDGLEAFASYGQGFSVNDIGRVLRATAAESVEQLRPEAQTVNSYELGTRFAGEQVDVSLVGFVNTSELGSVFSGLPELHILRSPERIWGLEATLDTRPIEDLQVGGTFTWLEGKRDAGDDGSFDTYLPGYRIPPLKVTGYLGYAPTESWQNRLQVLYSGARNRFPDGGFGFGDIEPFARIDFSTSFDLGSYAPGGLEFGIQNLLDTFYFPTVSEWWGIGSGYAAAPGRRFSMTYAVRL